MWVQRGENALQMALTTWPGHAAVEAHKVVTRHFDAVKTFAEWFARADD